MLRKAIPAAVLVILTTGPVSAQIPTPSLHLGGDKPQRTKEQKEYDKALDRAYQSTIKKIPETEKKPVDPWGDIRSGPPAQAKNKQ